MLKKETIFSLATPPGKSGVAVIRISGKYSGKILQEITRNKLPKPRTANLKKLFNPNNNEILDKALTLWFPAPKSFTGEDIVEIHIHGSRAIINGILNILANFPYTRLAEPGEFSKRAFYNGKMDLTEAEGLADLIDAETELQHKQAMRQYNGELKNLYETWRKNLIKSLSYLEAFIDFPDEEIPEDITVEICEIVLNLKKQITNHLNDNHKGERLRQGIYATIIGAPNVGKSSLLNYLAQKDIAIVSDIQGTTRDVIEIHLDIAGVPVIFADTAGIRESEDTIEKEGIKRAIEKANHADIKIIVLDASNFDNKSLSLVDSKSIILLNKIDKADKMEKGAIDKSAIKVSIKNKIGMENFMEKLEQMVKNEISPTSDPLITRIRYRKHLEQCLFCLNSFSLNNPIELACEDLRLAAREIGHITGIIDVETILDEIFSNFCIGK